VSTVKEFGETAKGLAKNPLGIIALFIVLVYAFASLVVGLSGNLEPNERIPIVWFLVIFPVVVLGVFAWLVSCHHTKLYAPSDFRREEHFLEAQRPDFQKLAFAAPDPSGPSDASLPTEEVADRSTSEARVQERNAIYAKHRGYFLVHVIEPSPKHGQEFDIFIYLIRHKSDDYRDIETAEFFFGHYWGNKIFEGSRLGKLIGVKTAAYGPFLCTCRIKFKDGESVMVYRYIDFEMGDILA
jgi:hypothetical protein